MLQQLTKDINQQPKKVRVMYELVKSVAAGEYTANIPFLLVKIN